MSANVRHSSESNEFYTPEYIVEPSRYVLGGFDCDPASSAFANELIRATVYYTEEQNGLLVPGGWHGRVILNCPGGIVDSSGRTVIHARTIKGVRYPGCTETGECGLPAPHNHKGEMSSAVTWWRALCGEWEIRHVTAAIFIGFSIELLQSCQKGEDPGHHPLDFPCCFPKDRIPFDVMMGLQFEPPPLGSLLGSAVHPVRAPGKQPTHSSVIVFLPFHDAVECAQSVARFEEAFTPLGYIHRGNGMYA